MGKRITVRTVRRKVPTGPRLALPVGSAGLGGGTRMRRLLAVSLVLALTTGLPSTTHAGAIAGDTGPHADEPSGGEDEEESTAPEPPPSDAVILTLDAEPYEARIDELYEVHWYRFTAVGGHDYWILADTSREGSWIDVDIAVSLHDATGAAVETAAENHLNELRWLLLTDAEAGSYYVRVGLDPTPIDHAGAYGIEIRTIDDDHGNTAATGTLVRPGSAATTEYTARTDYGGDRDWLVFDARAGDIYRIRTSGGGSVSLHMFDDGNGGTVGEPLTRWGTSVGYGELGGKPWRIERSGRYAVSLAGAGGGAGGSTYPNEYTVVFEKLTDDHSNTPDVTAALSVDRQTTAVLNYRGDEDWFHVDLVQGVQYVVEVSSGGDTTPSLDVVLYPVGSTKYRDDYDLNRHRLSYPPEGWMPEGRLLWTALETGRHLVNVRDTSPWNSTIHPVGYSLAVNGRMPDDHADGPAGATAIRPGTWLEGSLDILGDEDWYRFSAEASVAYTVEYELRAHGSEDFASPGSFFRSSDVNVYFIDDDWGFSGAAGYAFPTAGTQHLLVTTSEFASGRPWDYRFRLVEHERVDHGDDRGSAGALATGESVAGSATSADPDWFYFDVREPGMYAISTAQSQSAVLAVSVLDGSAEVPDLSHGFGMYDEQGALVVTRYWSAPATGRYWLRITGKWAAPFVYRLSVTRPAIEEDDHGDEAADATPVPLAPPEPRPPESGETTDTAEEGADAVTHGQASGRLEYFADIDMFALELQRGLKYRITPSATRPSRPGTFYPGYNREVGVTLWDGDTRVGSRDSWDPPIEYLPTVTGTYHVRVAKSEGGPFLEPRPYSFEVEVLAQDEHPDLLEDASPVNAGERIIGSLDTLGDTDWFRFAATRGQTWLLQSPRERWGCVELSDIAEGNRILKDCNSDRVIWTIPSSGDYAIKIFEESGYRWRSPGVDYDLTLSIVPLDDHGNSPADPSALIAGEPQAGQIDYIGDTDVFRLDAAEHEFWAIAMTRSDHRTSFGTEFVPSDPESAMPATWDRLRVGGVLATPTDGHWLISVGGSRASGDYTISAATTELSDDYGSNRAAAHALEAPLPDPACEHSAETCPGTIVVEGVLNHRFDSDYFRVPLVAGGRYEFRVRSSSDGVIFTLLTSEHCALRGPTTWEKSYDTWIPDATGDHWIRVGSKRLIDDPVTYTLEATARGDDFLTLTERATELEPNVVHEVGDEGDGGNNLYRVRFDHPRYVIEVTGGPSAWGTSPGEQFGGSYVDEDDRYLYRIPSNPPVEYQFRVHAGVGTPYTVVARERVPADESLYWGSVEISPGFPPDYCRPAGG